ncbi:MAG: SWIM zinc finger domain-containing protein [Planctomycetales bacterium]
MPSVFRSISTQIGIGGVVISLEQVASLAPDPASVAAGKKLMAPNHWPELGQGGGALWGKCQGSALYQVKVDLANLGSQCSCPSRKFPCKHVLGLLMNYSQSPEGVPERPVPDWVDGWIQKRREKQERQSAPAADPAAAESASKPADEKTKLKRSQQRSERVKEGVARLDLWLADLIHSGLAGLENRPAAFWDEPAKRLVDAQAPALAARVKRLAEIPRSSPDWPQRLLSELGRIRLLTHAFERLEELEPGLQSDVRQLVGWNVAQDELEQQGEPVEDTWVVVGQRVEDEDRLRLQRSWIVGRRSGRTGMILQYAAGTAGFTESIVSGTQWEGTAIFYPGAARLRCKFAAQTGGALALPSRMPGSAHWEQFLSQVSDTLARLPWLTALGGVVWDVTLVRRDSEWLARDQSGASLRIRGGALWKVLAVTGGHPFDLAAEWDGSQLHLLGYTVAGSYRTA